MGQGRWLLVAQGRWHLWLWWLHRCGASPPGTGVCWSRFVPAHLYFWAVCIWGRRGSWVSNECEILPLAAALCQGPCYFMYLGQAYSSFRSVSQGTLPFPAIQTRSGFCHPFPG